MLKILIAAGGSGGHLFPAAQLRELLKEEAEIAFAGHGLSKSPFFDAEKIPFVEIEAAGLKRGFFRASWRGFWQSLSFLRAFKPDVVVGFGSFHSFPVLLAAALLRKKMVLFEANSVLGKVNRLFLPLARKIAYQFPLSLKKGVQVSFLPWKEQRLTRSKEEARSSYGLAPHRNTLLVFGGSQGAVFFNETVPLACDVLKKRGFDLQVIHMTGKGEAKYTVPSSVKSFEKEMGKAYLAADVAICRAGAGTIAELICYQMPALLIPFPFAADDHQRKNGAFLTERLGAGRQLLQQEATPEKIAEEIEGLFKEKEPISAALQKAKGEKKMCMAELIRSVGEG